MIAAVFEPTYEGWRRKARELLAAGAAPQEIVWSSGSQPALFDAPTPVRGGSVRVSREFLKLAEAASLHRDEDRWSLMYRVLFRVATSEPHLLEDLADDDVRRLAAMRRQVQHDVHRMKAFVRFRETDGRYVAWYEPDHRIVRAAAPFFAARFGSMHWSILTPDECAHWDTRDLTFSPGAARSTAPKGDDLEDLWRTYYKATFNPARLNVDLMLSHLPKRKWSQLPEAEAIQDLVRSSPARTARMVQQQPLVSAAEFIPQGATLPVLREAVKHCRGCDLYRCATQPVFGEGPAEAKLAFIGEQPGDSEDREGRPFIGPAGQLFDKALAEVGLSRGEIYLSGAVKHFRYEQRGKQRIHKTASRAQVAACQPWLEAELQIVKPRLIVCMGNTAVLSVIGRGVRLLEERGKVMPHRSGAGVMATVHPGFLLRMPDAERQAAEYRRFVEDLRLARAYVAAA